MAHSHTFPSSRAPISIQILPTRTYISSSSSLKTPIPQTPSLSSNSPPIPIIPTMSEIIKASKSQNVSIHLQTLGPFFRITAKSLKTNNELGKAEGVIRYWLRGKILHLDSMKLQKETVGMEKSIFGIGLFIGAVAIRHGYDCGCSVAELLAINDSDLYHSKLVRFYTRIGFKPVYEVTGETTRDTMDRLVWGGYGTRMDADVQQLLIKWGRRLQMLD
ncbi:hypothetical protein ACHQM5_024900 [Ranunculus cassubicifolius]